jgi:tRNA-Thr(GGU) m(6)t(6)A37 methyltransferase TsaA
LRKNQILLKPIGVVKNGIPYGEKGVEWKSLKSKIEIFPEFQEGLKGIEQFSHIWVLFWMTPDETCLKIHPRGNRQLPEVGVFASRSPTRPNPIGLTLGELTAVEGNILEVRGLDAFDGTPVIDLKPFLLREPPPNLRLPDWA